MAGKSFGNRAAEVTTFDDDLRRFVADMHETMKASNGIGLAANQVGVLQRVITIEIPYSESRYSDQRKNARIGITRSSRLSTPLLPKSRANQLSGRLFKFPEIFDFVDRAAEVWLKAKDEFGNDFEVHANGLLACVYSTRLIISMELYLLIV